MEFNALPPDAVRIRSTDTSIVALVGLYIDPDGIVYNPDGSVNEPATAMAARAAVTAQVAAAHGGPTPYQVERGSVQEQSEADATRAYIDAQFSNVGQTAEQVVERVKEVAANATRVFPYLPYILGAAAVLWLYVQVKPIRSVVEYRSARKSVARGVRKAASHARRLSRVIEGRR